MARIIINLSNDTIANLLLGAEINLTPSVQSIDNLTEIILRLDDHLLGVNQEVNEDD